MFGIKIHLKNTSYYALSRLQQSKQSEVIRTASCS